MTPLEFSISRRLRYERMKQNLTQRELSANAGITNSVISRLEGGKTGASITTVLKLCKSLDITIGEFVTPISGEQWLEARRQYKNILETKRESTRIRKLEYSRRYKERKRNGN